MSHLNHSQKISAIKKYVKIKEIVADIKNPSRAEKAQITRYYNRLEKLGYFARPVAGYVDKDISRSIYAVKGAPKIKKIRVNVGTRIIGGEVVTDTRSKIKINRDGILEVTRAGNLKRWEFAVDLPPDEDIIKFKKHVKKRMKRKPRRGQIYVAGAGLWEMHFSATDQIEDLSKTILKLSNRYAAEYKEGARRSHPSEFMGRIVVYEGRTEYARQMIHRSRRLSKIKKRGRPAKRRKNKGKKK